MLVFKYNFIFKIQQAIFHKVPLHIAIENENIEIIKLLLTNKNLIINIHV